MEHFIHHLWPRLLGRRLIIWTDHNWLQTLKEPEGKLTRLLEQLQEYCMDVVYWQERGMEV